jgi:hypothetical protein
MFAVKRVSRRIGRSGQVRPFVLIVSAAGFIVTVVLTIPFGQTPADTGTQYTGTAIFDLGNPSTLEAEGTPSPQRNEEAVRQQLLSDEDLGRAILKTGDYTTHVVDGAPSVNPAALDRVRRSVQVTLDETASPNRPRISVTVTGDEPDRVLRLANTLAEDYVAERRAAADEAFQRQVAEAERRAQLARAEFFEEKGRFDAFLRRHILKQETSAERLAQRWSELARSADSPPTPRIAEPIPLPRVENPEEVALRRELADLERRRSQLLETRTGLHPLVQDIDHQIARVAGLADSMPAPASDATQHAPPPQDGPAFHGPPVRGPASQGPASQGPPAECSLGTAVESLIAEYGEGCQQEGEAFRTQLAAVDQAERHYRQLEQARRQAWEAQRSGSRFHLQLAKTCRAHGSTGPAPRPFLMVLVVGLMVAGGVGLIASGLGIDRPLETPADVEEAVPAPIVGIVSEERSEIPHENDRAGRIRRWSRVFWGVLLIAVCLGLMRTVFLGGY